jgi:molecular chaperone GrpE
MEDPITKQDQQEPTETETPDDQPQDNADAAVDMQALRARIAELEEEAGTNLQGWQRSRAEFTNYKRRTDKQLAESRKMGALDALGKVLPVIDDFERALANVPDDWAEHDWMKGTSLILKNMQKVLDEYDIEAIDPVGEDFDPNFHEAVGMDDSSEYESGVVTTTLQKGYRSGDRVVRPALVRVAS